MSSSRVSDTTYIFLVVLPWILPGGTMFGAELRVLPESERTGGEVRMLRDHLRPLVHTALDRRLKAYEELKTPEQIRAYQQRLRAEFIRSLGGFPERTPLRPRIVGRLEGDRFRVEKLIYESRPGFHVTAALYLPEAEPPYPGVLLPCGHSENGKAAELYQRAAILMARNGLAVLCYDPIGQGERKQILQDSAGRSATVKGRFRPTGNTIWPASPPSCWDRTWRPIASGTESAASTTWRAGTTSTSRASAAPGTRAAAS